ncbi:hypothetical protein F8M41_006134 [Gigaspora margarita]|uniref:Uncharacterized protein n=1 Tax=Gigaspora margarita TaxID=4874 RepID=A0A8H4EV57_GIGMA|nr:hypothetical protein F8M41_006134 [Gigaspora margarita]
METESNHTVTETEASTDEGKPSYSQIVSEKKNIRWPNLIKLEQETKWSKQTLVKLTKFRESQLQPFDSTVWYLKEIKESLASKEKLKLLLEHKFKTAPTSFYILLAISANYIIEIPHSLEVSPEP